MAAGSAVTLLVLLFAFRFQGFSRAVFVLDGLILLILLAGSRVTFRMLGRVLPATARGRGTRLLIYGAGDAGELLARELMNNTTRRYELVGFADDDPNKKGKLIHGLKVHGGNGSFLKICREHAVAEVLISSSLFPPARIEQIVRDCRAASVLLKRLRFQIEPIGELDYSWRGVFAGGPSKRSSIDGQPAEEGIKTAGEK